MLRRRKEKKTNYKKRLMLLKSRHVRIVIRKSLNNIHIQFVKYMSFGDITVVEETSKNLRKIGWKGHCGNIPAAYLCGLLAGSKARASGITEAVVDIGFRPAIKGSSVFAAAHGVNDAGITINTGDIFTDTNRLEGKHIEEYAKKIKNENETLYKKKFSQYLKLGLNPENTQQHFHEIKNKILKAM